MMTNRIMFILCFLGAVSLQAQEWKTELAKHRDKTVMETIKIMDEYFDKVGATRANKHHHYVRWQVQAINHMGSDGKSCNFVAKNQNSLQHFERVEQINSGNNRYFHGGWESVNPNNFINGIDTKPYMGRIDALAISPTNPDVLYAGASGGGVWKSWNNGANWFPLWDGMVQMGVSDIIVNHSNSNHIIVASGSADGGSLPSSGIFESFNGGIDWINRFAFPLDEKKVVYKMVQKPNDPNIFYLGTSLIDTAVGQLHKLNTSVGSMVEISTGTQIIHDMEYQTGSSDTLYLATRSGLFKMGSDEIVTQVSDPILPTFSIRGAISIAPSDQNFIYYLHTNNSNDYSLFRSTDGGISFTERMNETNSGHSSLIFQNTINLNLAVHPNNKETIFIGSVFYSKSTNGGAAMSWNLDSVNMHPDAHDIVIQNGKHYVCTDGGVSNRNLDKTIWENLSNGLLVAQFYKMDKNGNKLVGGTQDNGTLFWEEGDVIGLKKLNNDGFDCIYHPTIPDRILATTQQKLYYSNDNADMIIELIDHRWAAPIVHWEGIDSRVITFDNDNLRFSYDNGDTWPGSLDIFSDSTVYLISGFSQSKSNPNIAYASADKQLVKTANLNLLENSDWDTITPPLSTGLIFRDILVHPDNSNEVYVTLAGYNQEQIYKSINGGTTWTAYNQGLQDIPVYCIYYDHVNKDAFYIGTELGVFYRNSAMDEWIPFNTYLPRVQVMDLNITDTHVYAATFGRGIWKSPKFKACASNLTLTQANDPTINQHSGVQHLKASNTITSTRYIRGGVGTDVLYQAGNYVDLFPGFRAKDLSNFIARPGGCLD